MKKALSLFLFFVMAFCFTVTPFAANESTSYQEPHIDARFSDFANVNIYLGIDDFGFLHVEGSAVASNSNQTVKVTITLEQYMTDDFEWMGDDYIWTAEGYYGAGTQATRDVSVGSYRAKIYAECWENGTLREALTFYSNIVNVTK